MLYFLDVFKTTLRVLLRVRGRHTPARVLLDVRCALQGAWNAVLMRRELEGLEIENPPF